MSLSQPNNPRAARLADLGRCWFEMSGCCRGTTFYPVPLLAQRVGGQHLLGDVLPRLCCSACGDKPARIASWIELMPVPMAHRGDDASNFERSLGTGQGTGFGETPK